MAGIAKGSTKNEYSPKFIAEVLNLYKSGDYTANQLAEKYKIPERTIYNWTQKHNVSKGELIDKIQNAYEEEFARQGIDKSEIANITTGLLHAESNDYSDPKKVKKVPNYKVRKDGLDVYMKLVGAGKESEQTQQTAPIEFKILINNADGTVTTNLADMGIKF